MATTFYIACEYCGEVIRLTSQYYNPRYPVKQALTTAVELRVFGKVFGFCTKDHMELWLEKRKRAFVELEDEDN